MITNLEMIMFYIALTAIVYNIPKIIKGIGEVKQWKKAYDKQERIANFINEFENSMSDTENFNDIDEYIGKAILYD